jgi:hypothetical protein
MTRFDLFVLRISDNWGIEASVSPIGLILFGLFISVFLLIQLWSRRRFSAWAPVEAEVELGGIGKIHLRPNYDDINIAHRAWSELITRKAGLTFDEENDLILEIYDSWYALFGEMRGLVKQLPAERIRESRDTQSLLRLLVEALNSGLRPHLTTWQARFRRWYTARASCEPEKSPQQIQREYPEYDALVSDLRVVNAQLVQYAEVIRHIAHGG